MELTVTSISKQIYKVRGTGVLLDSDLAQLYQTETRILNQTVRRNLERFPEDFMFQLRKDEFEVLISQIVTSKKETRGGRQKLPLVFTELGVGMLSCILNNNRAIQVSVTALRAFAQVRYRGIPEDQTELMEKVDFLKREILELKQSYLRMESKLDLSFSTDRNLIVGNTPLRKRDSLQIERIQVAVSRYYQVSVSILQSKARSATVSLARQICMYLIRELTDLSYQKIGSHFGGRDHSTILHACGQIKSLQDKDIETREALFTIQSWISDS
jgi:hypothetical protein